MSPGESLSLEIEKPAAGGRMIARHDGQVVFVAGAIPGERVHARITNVRGGIGYADTRAIERPSSDRRPVAGDPACGGMVYAHVRYERQLQLKSEIIADAFARLGRLPLDHAVAVRPSGETGYRMRARLHVRNGHAGFFREGTHELCDAGATGQLLPATASLVGAIGERLRAGRIRDLRAIELSENVSASERALLVEASPESGAAAASRALAAFEDPGITGVGIMRGRHPLAARGEPYVHDVLHVEADGDAADVSFRRHAAAFFQGNRYLLPALAAAVVAHVPRGRLVDLYAGSGLFGLSFAALGRGEVTAVEGDEVAGEDLRENAAPYADRVLPVAVPVEEWVSRSFSAADATVLVDPPRTGMSAEASGAVARSGASRIVYVSCDVATLARDARRFADAGYRITAVEGFDLFPNTAHVETVVVFDR